MHRRQFNILQHWIDNDLPSSITYNIVNNYHTNNAQIKTDWNLINPQLSLIGKNICTIFANTEQEINHLQTEFKEYKKLSELENNNLRTLNSDSDSRIYELQSENKILAKNNEQSVLDLEQLHTENNENLEKLRIVQLSIEEQTLKEKLRKQSMADEVIQTTIVEHVSRSINTFTVEKKYQQIETQTETAAETVSISMGVCTSPFSDISDGENMNEKMNSLQSENERLKKKLSTSKRLNQELIDKFRSNKEHTIGKYADVRQKLMNMKQTMNNKNKEIKSLKNELQSTQTHFLSLLKHASNLDKKTDFSDEHTISIRKYLREC